jgi:hypothetical protein
VKWISAHLDEGIKQSESEERDVRIAMVYCLSDEHRGLSRAGRNWISSDIPSVLREGEVPVGFLFIDVLGNFDMERIVVVWLSCGGSTSDEKLELGCSGPISRRVGPHCVGQGK